MKKFKNIFLVLSLFLLAGFSVVLFSGEVSAQEVCYDYDSCDALDGTIGYDIDTDYLGTIGKIYYCFCDGSDSIQTNCPILTSYEETDSQSCKNAANMIKQCANVGNVFVKIYTEESCDLLPGPASCENYDECIDSDDSEDGSVGSRAQIDWCFCNSDDYDDCAKPGTNPLDATEFESYDHCSTVLAEIKACNGVKLIEEPGGGYCGGACPDGSIGKKDGGTCIDGYSDDPENEGCCTEDEASAGGESCEEPGPGDDIPYGEAGWFINAGDVLTECCFEQDDCRASICPDCSGEGAKQSCLDYMDYKSKMALGGTLGVNIGREQVKTIQTSVNTTCSSGIPVDCKLGYYTLEAIADCNICEADGLETKVALAERNPVDNFYYGCAEGYIESSDNNLCCEECIAPAGDSCSDDVRVLNDDSCCVCGGETFLKDDGVCYVEEEDCIGGTVGAGACNVEITEGGILRSVIGVPLGEAEPEEEKPCGKGVLEDGQSCCDGYKKFTDGGIKRCKECGVNGVCCGVKLSTNVPFIGDCIQFKKSASDPDTTVVGPTSAFPKLMQGLSKIMVTAILVFSFVLLVVAGVMMTASGGSDANYNKGKELIGKVIVGIALLGASGVILKLINPNFFG